MRIAKSIQTILCDDVRQETGRKISLMGIYSEDIIIKTVPYILPLMNLVLMLHNIQSDFKKLYITLYMPESKPSVFTFSPPSDIKIGNNINIAIGITPFKIEHVGKAKFEIRLKEDEKPIATHAFEIKTNA